MANWYKFGYAKTEEFTLPRFYPIFLLLWSFWVIAVIFLSVVAVGYESQSISTPDFNGTKTLWYQHFLVQTPWIAKPKVCQGEKINVDDC